jgi:hypothetical protein
MFMTLNKATLTPGLNRARPLRNCRMTGFVLSVVLPNQCLWRKGVDIKSREFGVNKNPQQFIAEAEREYIALNILRMTFCPLSFNGSFS